MPEVRSERQLARWAAGVLAAATVLLAAALGWLLVLDGHHPDPGLNKSEQAAVDAATRDMINLQSFRQEHFDDDFTRATQGLTGDLLKALSSKKASLLASLKQSKLDTAADVSAAAFEERKGGDALVLLTMNNYRVDGKGKRTLFGSGRFEVTVSNVKGQWLASNLTSVGLL